MDESKTRTFEAVFPKSEWADRFAEWLTDPGNHASDITHQKGRRRVTWEGPVTGEYFSDMRESVGYFGAPPEGPVATLNGIKAPRTW